MTSWLKQGIRIQDYFQPYKGTYKGHAIDSKTPPRYFEHNPNYTTQQDTLIAQTILERLRNGSIRRVGRIGTVDNPHLVMPLIVESEKGRVCHDSRFLNLPFGNRLFTQMM